MTTETNTNEVQPVRVAKRAFKWVVIPIVFLFVLFNVVSYLVLNIPAIQRTIVSNINDTFLRDKEYELSIESLSIGIVPARFTIKGLELRKRLPLDSRPEEESEDDVYEGDSIRIESLSAGVHLLQSYALRRPVLRVVEIDGLDITATPSSDDTPIDLTPVEDFLFAKGRSAHSALMSLFPEEVLFTDSSIEMVSSSNETIQRLEIAKVDVLKETGQGNDRLRISGVANSYFWNPGSDAQPLRVTNLQLDAHLGADDNLIFESVKVEANAGEFQGSGSLSLQRKLERSSYVFKTSASVHMRPALGLVAMDGLGEFEVSGTLRARSLFAMPLFRGRASWQNTVIEGFSAYSGRGEVEFRDKTIFGKGLSVDVGNNGRIHAEAAFEMFGPFRFRATGGIKDVSFIQLMSGLGVEHDVVEFGVDASEVTVTGQIVGNGNDDFFIKMDTLAQASGLFVPGNKFGKGGHKLPDCEVEVHLFADERHLDLGDTSGSCDEGNDLIQVTSGKIEFEGAKASFNVIGQDVDLSAVSYFLGLPTHGVAPRLSGRITSSAKEPILFSGKLNAVDVELFGFHFSELDSEISISPEMMFGKALNAVSVEGTEVALERFSVRYENVLTELRGTLGGNLSSLAFVNAGYLPEDFPDGNGKIKSANVNFFGPLFNPRKWDLDTTFAVEDLKIGAMSFETIRTVARCKAGDCRDSRVQVVGVQSLSPGADKGIDRSFAVFDFSQLSFDTVSMRAQLSKIPMAIFAPAETALRGRANGRVDMTGKWESWQGNVMLNVDGFQVGNQNFGFVNLQGVSDAKNGLNLTVNSKYNQIQLRVRTPADLRGRASIYARINNYDVGTFFTNETRVRLNLLARMSGDLLLEGDAPFTATQGHSWLETWTFNGTLRRVDLQTHQFAFQLKSPVAVRFDGRKLSLEESHLVATNQDLLAVGSYDIKSDLLDVNLNGKLNLSTFQAFFSRIIAADGDVRVGVRVNGPLKKLRIDGGASVEGQALSFRDFAPPFTNIRGEVVFEKDRLEIRSLSAKKGSGNVDVAGSISWAEVLSGESDYPQFAVRVAFASAQFRLPARVFGTVDSSVSGNVQVTGSTLPYVIAGDLTVEKLVAARDVNCREVIEDLVKRPTLEQQALAQPTATLNLSIIADRSIQVQSECMRAKMSAEFKVTGPTSAYSLTGTAKAENGYIQYQKRKYAIQKWDMVFENPVRIDPRVDVRVMSEVSTYKIYVNATGTVGNLRTDIWSDPATFPSGEPLSRQDILRMMSSGQVPQQRTASAGGGYVLASSAADYIITPFDDPLSQTVALLTGGFIDSVQLRPVIEEGGQNKLKARVTKSIGERLNLSIDVDLGPASASNTQTLRGTFLLNETVNLLGELDKKSNETTSRYQLLGGVRFQFGNE